MLKRKGKYLKQPEMCEEEYSRDEFVILGRIPRCIQNLIKIIIQSGALLSKATKERVQGRSP